MDTTKLLFVEWVDAVADAGWSESNHVELHDCATAGFLIDETEDAILIAATISMGMTNARMHIPKAWIKTRKEFIIEDILSEGEGQESSAVVS